MRTIVAENNVSTLTAPTRETNRVSTTLYTFYNFLPFSLFNQVRKPTNLYFILIAVLSMFPTVSTIDPISAIFPVVFVIVFSMSFDLYEDFRRYIKDQAANQKEARVFRDGEWRVVPFEAVQVGDFVCVRDGEEICADLVLLAHRSNSNYAYIKTSNLDGEKNLKPKISVFDKLPVDVPFVGQNHAFELVFEGNSEALDKFGGVMKLTADPQAAKSQSPRTVHLTNTNFLPRSCILKNTQEVIGVTVYIGMDTKIMRNTNLRTVKISSIEQQMNSYILLIVAVLCSVLLIAATYAVCYTQKQPFFVMLAATAPQSAGYTWIVTLLSYFLLLNTILPISLIVTLQLVKTAFTLAFRRGNAHMPEVQANTFSIHEELGQIEHVLSDKTGTLTKNRMVLRRFQIANVALSFNVKMDKRANEAFRPFSVCSSDRSASVAFGTEEDVENIFLLLINSCHECFTEQTTQDGPKGGHPTLIIENDDISLGASALKQPSQPKRWQPRNASRQTIGDSFKTVGYTSKKHAFNVTTFELLSQMIEIQGPSPDEIALLRTSKQFCGYLCKASTNSQIVIHRQDDTEVSLEVLLVNKFNSVRRMMSVVVVHEGTRLLFVKGADSAIESCLRRDKDAGEQAREKLILDANDAFVKEGFRCLLFAIRVISEPEWRGFERRLAEARTAADHETATQKVLLELESELTLLGASGIEDKLQDNLVPALRQIREAGIKVWMITGDKLETAENISLNSGLFDARLPVIRIRHREDVRALSSTHGSNVVVEGSLFGELFALKDADYRRLRDLLIHNRFVSFCRTNANQKVEIVRMVKAAGRVTLSIGDGANDVSMIQEASVGVGILGEEGRQASNAADFAIPRFELLPDLIFSHGRLSYFRISNFILFFFYKNFLFTFPQIMYGFFTGFGRLTIFPSWYMSFFNLLFTSFPVAARALFDCDLNDFGRHTRRVEVATYYLGKEKIGFNLLVFCQWLLLAALEITLVFVFGYLAYADGAYSHNHELTYECFSMLLYGVIVYHLGFKIVRLTTSFTWFQVICYLLGFVLFTLYFLASDYFSDFGFYKVNSQIWFTAGFWLALGFCLFALSVAASVGERASRLLGASLVEEVNSRLSARSPEKEFDWLNELQEKRVRDAEQRAKGQAAVKESPSEADQSRELLRKSPKRLTADQLLERHSLSAKKQRLLRELVSKREASSAK